MEESDVCHAAAVVEPRTFEVWFREPSAHSASGWRSEMSELNPAAKHMSESGHTGIVVKL